MLCVYKKGVCGLKIIVMRRKIFFVFIVLMIFFLVLFLLIINVLVVIIYKMMIMVDVNVCVVDNIKGKVIGFYKKGIMVIFIVKIKNNWYKMIYKGKVGYVLGKCVIIYKVFVVIM